MTPLQPLGGPLPFNPFATVTYDGRCTRCYAKVLTGGCPNVDCDASPMRIRVFIIPVQLIDEIQQPPTSHVFFPPVKSQTSETT